MQSENIIAPSQAGGLSLDPAVRLVGFFVLAFLLLEVVYLACWALFVSCHRGAARRNAGPVRRR